MFFSILHIASDDDLTIIILCTFTREAIIIIELNTHSINVHVYDRIKTGTPIHCMNFFSAFRSINAVANHGWCLAFGVLVDAIKSRKRHATCIIIIITCSYLLLLITSSSSLPPLSTTYWILFDGKKFVFSCLQADIIMWALILRREGNKLRSFQVPWLEVTYSNLKRSILFIRAKRE